MNRLCAVLMSLAVVLVACDATTGGTSSAPSGATVPSPGAVSSLIATSVPETNAPTAAPSPTPSQSDVPVVGDSPTPGASASPASIDPCTLLTAAEASQIIGLKMSAGVSEFADPDRVCTFKSGRAEVKVFLAPPAADAAAAKAYWDAERAQVPADVQVKDLTEFDRSAYGTGASVGLPISALFVIDGTNFFEVYCAFPACSQKASLGAADHIAGRLP